MLNVTVVKTLSLHSLSRNNIYLKHCRYMFYIHTLLQCAAKLTLYFLTKQENNNIHKIIIDYQVKYTITNRQSLDS